jgi:hypothetical protein
VLRVTLSLELLDFLEARADLLSLKALNSHRKIEEPVAEKVIAPTIETLL